jgi:hypothetical protein
MYPMWRYAGWEWYVRMFLSTWQCIYTRSSQGWWASRELRPRILVSCNSIRLLFNPNERVMIQLSPWKSDEQFLQNETTLTLPISMNWIFFLINLVPLSSSKAESEVTDPNVLMLFFMLATYNSHSFTSFK